MVYEKGGVGEPQSSQGPQSEGDQKLGPTGTPTSGSHSEQATPAYF